MVDWTSPAVQELTMFLFREMTVFVLGVYAWYFVLTLSSVEIPLLRRRLRVQLAHVPYIIGRYTHLISLFAVTAMAHMQATVSCSGIHFLRLIAVTGNVALAAASANLALRAIVLWGTVVPSGAAQAQLDSTAARARWRKATVIVWILRSLCVCHVLFGFVLGIAGPQTAWQATPITPGSQASATMSAVSPTGSPSNAAAAPVTTGIVEETCVIVMGSARGALFAFYVFTLAFDVLILALTLTGLRAQGFTLSALIGGDRNSVAKRLSVGSRKKDLTGIVLTQGVLYTLVTVGTCVPMAVLTIIRTNEVMGIFFVVPGCTVSVIASSAVVTSLFNINSEPPEEVEPEPDAPRISVWDPQDSAPDIALSNTRRRAVNRRDTAPDPETEQSQVLSTVFNMASLAHISTVASGSGTQRGRPDDPV